MTDNPPEEEGRAWKETSENEVWSCSIVVRLLLSARPGPSQLHIAIFSMAPVESAASDNIVLSSPDLVKSAGHANVDEVRHRASRTCP